MVDGVIPSPWVAVILVLGTMRILREVSYGDFPPVERLRNWVMGAHVVRSGSQNALNGLTSEQPTTGVSYRRPTLAKFIQCVWCSGFWISTAVYLGLVFEPRYIIYGLAPFALSSGSALVVKWLDP